MSVELFHYDCLMAELKMVATLVIVFDENRYKHRTKATAALANAYRTLAETRYLLDPGLLTTTQHVSILDRCADLEQQMRERLQQWSTSIASHSVQARLVH